MDTHTPSTNDRQARRDVLKAKRRYGVIYGVVAGLSFAISNWGVDAFLLSQVNALQPWLKLIVAILICLPVGGATGWLVSRLDKPLAGVILWLAAGGVFAWLSVANTFQLYPTLLARFHPDLQPFLKYSIYDIIETNGTTVYIWTSIFWSILGLIQVPLLERAVFSLSSFSKLMPFLVCMVLIIIGGLFVDNLNNEPLRSPIIALDQTVQFAVDKRGQEVDSATARRMHLAALRDMQDLLDQPRFYFVSKFDSSFGQVQIIIDFAGERVDCSVVYNQVGFCKRVSP